MSSSGRTYTLKDFLDEYNKLRLTPLNSVYQAYFNSECVTFRVSYAYCTPDENYASLSDHLIDLYKKFVRNLVLISNVNDNALDHLEKNKDKHCLYLKYWFYDNLIIKSVRQDEFIDFLTLWNTQKSEKCKECDCQFEINTISEIKELKSIYDYFLFRDAYNEISKINEEISEKMYCEYIKNAKIKYLSYKEKCATRSDPDCSEFKKYIEEYLKVYQDEDSSIICNYEEKPDSDTHTAQDLHHSQEQNSQGVTDNLVPDSSNDGKSTGTIISASSVGIIGLLFLLYKFTPLRSRIDPLIRKTKKNLKNGVQGCNELQSQDYDIYSPDMHFNRYNIGYQST